MTCLRSACLALLALPLCAAVVDVSQAETALVRTGDTLSYDIFTSNYALNAQAFGLPLYPSDANFVLVTNRANLAAQFTATLVPADASFSVVFDDPIGLTPGYLSSAEFQGAVSMLQGHLHLSPELSQDVFGGGSVRLNLQNIGEDLTLGLSTLTFRKGLFFTLSGGPLSVGAMPGGVTLESSGPLQDQFAGTSQLSDTVPEPDSWWLFSGGGALLCVVSALLNRLNRPPA